MQIGIDLGSRTIKMAVFRDGQLIARQLNESGFDPTTQAMEMIRGYAAAAIVATGYGRHLAAEHFAHDVITEIKAHAIGARHFFPDCRTIVDIGGQDSKVITLAEDGRVLNFRMNDKCAAGTGRFLEIMAATLGYRLEDFGPAALESQSETTINSMCTVFAESEVISLKNRGILARDIARAVHFSVVNRLVGMLERLGYGDQVVFTGGVAKNPCVAAMLRERLPGTEVVSPPEPDLAGAMGAAIHASCREA